MAANKNAVRVTNERHVLEQVFNYGPISRSQVSKNLDLNKVTVSEIVADLLSRDYLIELGQGDSTKNGGRKPTMLQFNADLGYVIVYDLGFDFVDRMVNKIDGTIVAVDRYPVGEMTVEERINLMIEMADLSNMEDQLPLLGVAVSVHGIVNENRVIYTPTLDFKGLDVAKMLWQKLNVPVVLENEANLSVIYERDFDTKEWVSNIVCVSIHKGIGAGIILHNQLYRGNRGEAGEIGHTILTNGNFADGETPATATIEQMYSEDAIIERLRKDTGDAQLGRQDVVKRYRAGDPVIHQYLDEFCRAIANVIYNVGVTMAPQLVALNSGLVAAIPELFSKIQADMPRLTENDPPVILVKDVRNATLLGGASIIIHQLLNVESGALSFN
ncbi:ROK family protein [Lacticaseibacillus jixianensis]|uniref:ROK family protein n=1 Tax=Lacticaseibacillus jixianensis TaxID=2486012 RepID=A0ABW4B8V2_9LACO|nr:ROK family protein [Lacticaseibacillus jixianensis]